MAREPKSIQPIAIGQRFGRVTVIGTTRRKHYFRCRCDCGHEWQAYRYNLLEGRIKQCLLCRNGPRTDLAGQRFGHWTVLKYLGRAHWRCRCDCGLERTFQTYRLRHISGSAGCRNCAARAQVDKDRLTLIRAGLSAGLTPAAIARLLKLSRQRMAQIIKRQLTKEPEE